MPVAAADANKPASLEDMQRIKGIRNQSLYFCVLYYDISYWHTSRRDT
jgi:hypothetical protein